MPAPTMTALSAAFHTTVFARQPCSLFVPDGHLCSWSRRFYLHCEGKRHGPVVILSTGLYREPHRTIIRSRVKRMTNLSRSELSQVEGTVVPSFFDHTPDTLAANTCLRLERSSISFMPLSWTLAHFKDASSPIVTMTEGAFREAVARSSSRSKQSTMCRLKEFTLEFPTQQRTLCGTRSLRTRSEHRAAAPVGGMRSTFFDYLKTIPR
jgi:hypothetical protein